MKRQLKAIDIEKLENTSFASIAVAAVPLHDGHIGCTGVCSLGVTNTGGIDPVGCGSVSCIGGSCTAICSFGVSQPQTVITPAIDCNGTLKFTYNCCTAICSIGITRVD